MIVLSGLEETVPNMSFGKLILDCLRSKNFEDVALIDAHTNARVTYGEILEQSIVMASNFQRIGISKDDVIALVAENNLNYIIPVFAALYIGAIVQPANPVWNYRELVHIFEISKPKWVICSETSSKVIDQLRSKIESIQSVFEFGKESYSELLSSDKEDLLNFQIKSLEPSKQVAFVFSSSGTTGLPKGVMITHQNMVHTVKYWTNSKYGNYQKGDVTVVPMPLFHLFGMNMILISIIAGVKYIMMGRFNPELYLHCIERYRANKISGPPPLICFLAKSSMADKYDLSSVRDIISGSAPLKPKIEKAVQMRFNVTLRQTYATTETAGACTIIPNNSTQCGSCGVLLPNIKARVRDVHTDEILGFNQIGELCFKGPILMKGYMNNPEVTRNAFDDDGFYLTGDIGYFNNEGYFFIVDRLKDMIKYKGFQISPAELEGVLLSHPYVADAAVIGIPNEKVGEVPFAYVVQQKTGVTEKELMDFVQENVSAEKRLYGGLLFIDEIPRNPSGKILKLLLKQMKADEDFVSLQN